MVDLFALCGSGCRGTSCHVMQIIADTHKNGWTSFAVFSGETRYKTNSGKQLEKQGCRSVNWPQGEWQRFLGLTLMGPVPSSRTGSRMFRNRVPSYITNVGGHRAVHHGRQRSAERLAVMRRMFYLAQQRCQLIEIDRLANMMIEARGHRQRTRLRRVVARNGNQHRTHELRQVS
jgi:hypothetical protein